MENVKMCYHTLIDLYDVEFQLLNDLDLLLDKLRNISTIINLTILTESYHKFEPQGVTIMLLLSESHISIHTWPENKSACLDILSCKNNPHDYINDIIKLFNTNNYNITTIKR